MSELSEQQRANLTKLAAYLRTLPEDYPDFAMSQFVAGAYGQGFDPASVPECGTAACAAGHGPSAGVPFIPGETWAEYSFRAFVPREDEDGNDWGDWDWCFGAGWASTDNTAHGAAARIEWFLKNGVPDDGDDQRWGDAPLCYALSTPPRVGEG